jgi:hypothetical protein
VLAPFAMASAAMLVLLPRRRRRIGIVAVSNVFVMVAAVTYALLSIQIVPRLAGLQPVADLGRVVASTAAPNDRVGFAGGASADGLVFYSRHRVDALPTTEDIARYLEAPGRAFCVLSQRDVETVKGVSGGAVYEIAASPKLVLRFNRLFGSKPPYDDMVVLISNRK